MYKALYEYDSSYKGALSFKTGDLFTVLDKKSSDWWTMQNGFGEVGYVPVSYVVKDSVEHCEVLRSIDSAIEAVHVQAAEAGGQYSHQQRENLQKLIRHRQTVIEEQRCERAQSHNPKIPADKTTEEVVNENKATKRHSSKKRAPPPPDRPSSSLEESHSTNVESETTSGSISSEVSHESPQGSAPMHTSSSHLNSITSQLTIPSDFGCDLVEAVRRNTDLSHDKSIIAVETVLCMIKNTVPETGDIMDKIAVLLDQKVPSDNLEFSQDADRLRSIFSKLGECKDDSQQRGWSLYQDEGMITEQLEQLISILSDANQSVCRRVVAEDHYDAVHTLVLYYQMETRKSIRLLLLQVFGALCGLEAEIVTLLMCSVLPLELVTDIQTDTSDIQKLCYSALVLTMIFSTGESVPFNHYEHLNSTFVNFLLDKIEEPPESDLDDQIPDMFVHLILGFNLHFVHADQNTVMEELARHCTAKTFTEKILLLINREEDPVHMFEHTPNTPNSVVKFLHDLFATEETSGLLYTNDAHVLLDIIIRQLSNLSSIEKVRHEYLVLVYRIIKNCSYDEYIHRSPDLQKCFMRISMEEEEDSDKDKEIVKQIWREFPSYFGSPV